MQGIYRVFTRMYEIKTRFGIEPQNYKVDEAESEERTQGFNGSQKESFDAALKKAITSISGVKKDKIYDVVKKASEEFGVDPNLILAVMKAESGFNKNAVSRAGAIGLMQLMPQTARSLGVNPYNYMENVEGGTLYLKKMLDMFDQDISLALAAYNAGPQNVKKYGGIPPFNETKNYVEKVIKYYNEFSRKD